MRFFDICMDIRGFCCEFGVLVLMMWYFDLGEEVVDSLGVVVVCLLFVQQVEGQGFVLCLMFDMVFDVSGEVVCEVQEFLFGVGWDGQVECGGGYDFFLEWVVDVGVVWGGVGRLNSLVWSDICCIFGFFWFWYCWMVFLMMVLSFF